MAQGEACGRLASDYYAVTLSTQAALTTHDNLYMTQDRE